MSTLISFFSAGKKDGNHKTHGKDCRVWKVRSDDKGIDKWMLFFLWAQERIKFEAIGKQSEDHKLVGVALGCSW